MEFVTAVVVFFLSTEKATKFILFTLTKSPKNMLHCIIDSNHVYLYNLYICANLHTHNSSPLHIYAWCFEF